MQFVFAFDSCAGTDMGGSKAKAVELLMTEAAEEEARVAAAAKAAEEARVAAEAKAEAERVAAEAKAAQEAQLAAEAKAAEEERLRLESEKKVAEEKALAEKVAKEAAEKAAKDEADRKAGEQVAEWCKKNGFKDMSTQKGSKIPLHVAVTKKDAEMVGFMVQLGVDKGVKTSKGQTATDLATKLNKGGSMDAILASLK